jgi:hypothetical protein
VAERLEATLRAVAAGKRTAVAISPELYDEPLSVANAAWFLAQTLCYLRHLEAQGKLHSEPADGTEQWVIGAS